MEGRITITINKQIWIELSKLKIKKDLRSFDEVIKYLLREARKK